METEKNNLIGTDVFWHQIELERCLEIGCVNGARKIVNIS